MSMETCKCLLDVYSKLAVAEGQIKDDKVMSAGVSMKELRERYGR